MEDRTASAKGYGRVIFSGTRERLAPESAHMVAREVRRWARLATEIGVGDCPHGVDALVRGTLLHEPVILRVFKADWIQHGRAAGPMRNAEMVLWCTRGPAKLDDVLVAFPGPRGLDGRGRGTRDCITRGVNAGLVVVSRPVAVEAGR